jgi:hypothetical protein
MFSKKCNIIIGTSRTQKQNGRICIFSAAATSEIEISLSASYCHLSFIVLLYRLKSIHTVVALIA